MLGWMVSRIAPGIGQIIKLQKSLPQPKLIPWAPDQLESTADGSRLIDRKPMSESGLLRR